MVVITPLPRGIVGFIVGVKEGLALVGFLLGTGVKEGAAVGAIVGCSEKDGAVVGVNEGGYDGRIE
jgi:hypothetical protein